MSLKNLQCSRFSWSFSVQQQAAPKRKRALLHISIIKLLYLYNYVSTKISGVSRVNYKSL